MQTRIAAPQQMLKVAFEQRKRRNPRYSLRAFAKTLGVSHTVLSLVLSGKRPLSKKTALKAANFLGLEGELRNWFVQNRAQASQAQAVSKTGYERMELETFEVLAEPLTFAILSLLEIPGERLEAKRIARRLSVSEEQATTAIEKLRRLELVAQRADGSWRQSGRPIKIENDRSTLITRRFHRELLEQAIDSLETTPKELRDYTSMTFAMAPEHVSYALERIRAFKRSLVEELEAFGRPQEVYHLSVQLFPASVSTPDSSSDSKNYVRKEVQS